MRIVHVVDAYVPALGYQESAIAQHQRLAGHQVAVITGRDLGAGAGELGWARQQSAGCTEENGVPVYRLPVFWRLPGGDNRVWMRGLSQTLQALQPDVVHVHNLTHFSAVRVAIAKPALRYRLIFDNHQSHLNIQQPRSMVTRWLRNGYYALFRRLAAPVVRAQADVIVAVGENEQAFIADYVGLPVSAIPIIRLGADRAIFRPDDLARREQRDAWNVAEHEVVCLHAGQFRPGKRLDMLLQAAASLRTEGWPVRVVLIGGGYPTYQQQLKAEAVRLGLAGHVLYEPFLDQPALARRLAAADIGVWPGFYSITFIQALATGLPVVAADSPYNRNTLGAAGRWFAEGDGTALTAALRELVSTPNLRQELARHALERVARELNWETISQRFVELYAKPSEGV
jgi:glycosyltransferase involved in cell wall biosynthesis